MLIVKSTGEELRNIHDNSFPFPDLSNNLYISRRIAISSGQIIGGGLVKITAEGILILDENIDIQTRALASRYIIEALKKDCKMAGLDDCHVFVKKEKVRRFLECVGFKDCLGGNPMVIQF
jgi:hypothetical protein